MRVIETNLSMKNGIVFDHQSRVVTADSWKDYCKAFSEYDGTPIEFKSETQLAGNTLPKMVEIKNLKYDDFHLSCDVIFYGGFIIDKKLAYLIESQEK